MTYVPTIWEVPNNPDTGEMQLDILEREQLQHAARSHCFGEFPNPSGQSLSAEMREQFTRTCNALQLPVVEDNPYGELWFDQPLRRP